MIDGVQITPLKKIDDKRGSVLHMMRNDVKIFRSFGEIYFSIAYPLAINYDIYSSTRFFNFFFDLKLIGVFFFLFREITLKFFSLRNLNILPPNNPLEPVIRTFNELTPFIRYKFIVRRFSYYLFVAIGHGRAISKYSIIFSYICKSIPN